MESTDLESKLALRSDLNPRRWPSGVTAVPCQRPEQSKAALEGIDTRPPRTRRMKVQSDESGPTAS